MQLRGAHLLYLLFPNCYKQTVHRHIGAQIFRFASGHSAIVCSMTAKGYGEYT